MFRQLIIAYLVGLALASSFAKVDNKLLATLQAQGRANVVVSFTQGNEAVLRRVNGMKFASRGAKITTMKSKLEELQASSQKNSLGILSAHNVTFHSLWINNRLYIEDAKIDLVTSIAALPEVAEVREEFTVPIFDEPIQYSDGESDVSFNPEWGIAMIEADQAWSLRGGNNGTGIVVATLDTGARYTHEALRNNYREEYGWFDPSNRTPLPSDNNGHGTHVMGIIVGSNGIGVAPGAQWIATRPGTVLSPPESAFVRCGQWIACPTLPDGVSSPDCSKAPHIVSNSWGGGQGQTWFDSIIDAWHTAGIISVFANGNSGPTCGSANSPADNPTVIAVGSTTRDDVILSYSSRGPARSGILKPDVSAPGSDIRSSWMHSDTGYNTISGTSVATPHVAGTIALLLSHNPDYSFAQVKSLLQDYAERNLGNATTCGNTPPHQFPNNIYGHGRINARRSLAAAILTVEVFLLEMSKPEREIFKTEGGIQVEICFGCMALLRPIKQFVTGKNIMLMSWSEIADHLNNPETSVQHGQGIYVGGLQKVAYLLDEGLQFSLHFERCVNIFKFEDGHQALRSLLEVYEEPNDQVLHLMAYLWTTIWGNYTYQVSSTRNCRNGEFVLLQKEEWLEGDNLKPSLEAFAGFIPYPFHLPLFVRDQFHALQFVSCGRRGTELMAFGELVSPYQSNVWGCLLVSMFLVAWVQKRIWSVLESRQDSVVKSMIPLIKLLLEQGDPFPQNVLERIPLRMLAISMLLMGIIISNGYKNTNVEKMIQPRRPLPYEYFQELVDDQFTVYCISAKISGVLQSLSYQAPSPISAHQHGLRGISPHMNVDVRSQLYRAWETVSTSGSAGNDQLRLIEEAKNHSKLSPAVVNSFKEVAEELLRFIPRDNYDDSFQDIIERHNRNEERELLFQEKQMQQNSAHPSRRRLLQLQ